MDQDRKLFDLKRKNLLGVQCVDCVWVEELGILFLASVILCMSLFGCRD